MVVIVESFVECTRFRGEEVEVESKVDATAKANKTRKGKRTHVICMTKTRCTFAPHGNGPHPGFRA